ncbi:hypothetical protein [Colwellia sp. 12G3]|uniref:hypothetical protein n=1 Tax=Colwellia sp. 12G3 TaxID=2058299 RepID=UPI0012FF0781|nr:hypothetical protein [Colwellia sp. 12G3]
MCQYLKDFDEATKASSNSAALVNKLKGKYPTIGGDSILDLSAKVIMGEVKWP